MNYSGINTSTRFKYDLWQFFDHKIGRDKAFKWFLKPRKKLEQQLVKEIKGRDKGKNLGIKEVVYKDKDQIAKLIKENKPFVLRQLAKDWNCVQKWSPEYLRELHGEDEIVFVDNSDRKNNKFEITHLKDIIDNMNNGGAKYYRFYPLLRRHPEHVNDFDYKWLRHNSDRGVSKVEVFHTFIGGNQTETDIHCGFSSNFFTQAHGQKRWVMVGQEFTPIVDPFPGIRLTRSGNGYAGKPFSFFNPDYETYPGYEYVDYYDVTLDAGDVLYVPPFMYHNVINLSPSIGVAYRWISYASAFRSSPLFFSMDMTMINPSIWKCFNMHAEDTNIVHLMDMGLIDDYIEENKKSEKPLRSVIK